MKCYYGWNANKKILLKSSSGGIFSAVAEYIINAGGVVFGATLDSSTSIVKHIGVNTLQDLSLIRGSKYQQSFINSSYQDVKKILSTSKPVLFSGTPCQIVGLVNYLKLQNCDIDNLICVEVLCHGVTNDTIVRKYLKSIEKKYNQTVKNYSFRTKKKPWYHSGSSMHIVLNNDKELYRNHLTDEFYISYGSGLILRPSCYSCPFTKTEGRIADLTIGDFWGAENYISDKTRLNQGIGLILANTEKGEMIIDHLSQCNKIYYNEIEFDKATPRNDALIKPTKQNHRRNTFIISITNGDDYINTVRSVFRKRIVKARTKLILGYKNVQRIKKLRRVIRSRG